MDRPVTPAGPGPCRQVCSDDSSSPCNQSSIKFSDVFFFFNILYVSAAPSQPSLLSFSEVTGGSVNVSWGAPLSPNGQVEGYRVIYEPTSPIQGVHTHMHTLTGVHVDSCADTSLRLSAGVTKLVTVDVKGSWQRWLKVRDLIKGETYTFSVQALTVSYGPPIQANITAQPVKGMIGCIESCQIQLEIAVYCT